MAEQTTSAVQPGAVEVDQVSRPLTTQQCSKTCLTDSLIQAPEAELESEYREELYVSSMPFPIPEVNVSTSLLR